MQAYTHKHSYTCTHTHTHARTHAHTHACIKCTHTHTTHTHTHILMLTLALYRTSTTMTIAKKSCYSFMISEYTHLCLFSEYTHLCLFSEYANLWLFSEYPNLCLLFQKDTDCWLFHLIWMKAFLVILGVFFGGLHRQCVVPLTRRQWKCSGCSTKNWTLSRKSWRWKQCLVTHHTPNSLARPIGRVPWNGELSAVWW